MAKRKTQPKPPSVQISSYWQFSQQPLQALFFMVPLMLLYELGLLLYTRNLPRGVWQDIYARSLLFQMFDWFGVEGYYWPALIVVAVLLAWHVLKKDPWRIEPGTYAWMWLESLVLAVPLFVFALVMFRQPVAEGTAQRIVSLAVGHSGQAALIAAPRTGWQAQLVFSIGAGIYEELVFRLMAIAVLHALFVDLLALPEKAGAAASVGISALAFALYHFSAQNPFALDKCLFYTAAGVYFAAVYVVRGFGIVAGTHAMYDVLVVALEFAP